MLPPPGRARVPLAAARAAALPPDRARALPRAAAPARARGRHDPGAHRLVRVLHAAVGRRELPGVLATPPRERPRGDRARPEPRAAAGAGLPVRGGAQGLARRALAATRDGERARAVPRVRQGPALAAARAARRRPAGRAQRRVVQRGRQAVLLLHARGRAPPAVRRVPLRLRRGDAGAGT